jgi:LytS/YehU family sensor histidine kinase
VADEEQEYVDRVWRGLLSQPDGSRSTNRNITKDKKLIICEWYNTPLKNSKGEVIGLASLVEDITERKELERDLEKAISILEKNYSETKEQMQTYFTELQFKKNELLNLQKENLQSQFDMLKNQVNPHFLFNSLNVLSSLISSEPELAERFTEHLSKIYRYVLENKDKEVVNIETEISFINSYIFLLNIRFKDKMKIDIRLNDGDLKYNILPLAMQVLIENAVKHNAFSKRNPLLIEIFVDNQKYLNIINNYQKREQNIQSTGLGLVNISNRYKFFTSREPKFGIIGDKYVAKIPLLP